MPLLSRGRGSALVVPPWLWLCSLLPLCGQQVPVDEPLSIDRTCEHDKMLLVCYFVQKKGFGGCR